MAATVPSIILLRNHLDEVLQDAGWPRFRPATPGRPMRAGYALCCMNTGLLGAGAGSIRLRHYPYDNAASAAAHAYWQTLLTSEACRDMRIVAEVTDGRRGGLTIWIASYGKNQKSGVA